MGIELYPHNQTAYEAAVAMLADRGKAAVIHPTGTGKSVIGFKLAEDEPKARILWLSPSEYIFKTQVDSLWNCSRMPLNNVRFFTYARLMLLSEDELEELRPDYIILDEFHRCGAEMWGRGVQSLLNKYPTARLLGLSATNIRYLDNRRDMADELFDGNVASRMNLGEALVRGILNPPVYVTALYAFQNNLEQYMRRAKRIRANPTRQAVEQYLEALRHMLNNADGLDVIFQKYINDKQGKYLVFCANKEHMQEMVRKVPEQFGKIDAAPHVYQVYYGDAETNKAFQEFKKDRSNHLKLLYSIDMLNEGIHVDDLSGVILFRPTVSPIIYKQQIGRALCVGKKRQAIILDVVNNVSNLYSASAIQDEMDEVIELLRERGSDEEIVNERFQVIDTLQDCRRLFAELERTLSIGWDEMYEEAKRYYIEHGDLLPSYSYVTESGYPFGEWITTQRTKHSQGLLSKEKIQKLEAIGMDWRTQSDRNWDRSYLQAEAFYRKYGHLSVMRKNDPELSAWLVSQRFQYRCGQLTEDRVQRLTEIGMVWEPKNIWDSRMQDVKQYLLENGNLDIPANYETKTGIKLGPWMREIRRQYQEGTLSREKANQLEALGIEWTSVAYRNWMNSYHCAKEYYTAHGNLDLNPSYVTEHGDHLGTWISSQRYRYKLGRLSLEQIRLLEGIGMSWNRYDTRWNEGYRYAQAYQKVHGNLEVPANMVTEDGYRLGAWVANQRGKYRNGKLEAEQIRRLEELGIRWNIKKESWPEAYAAAKQYYQERGTLQISSNYTTGAGFRLGNWVANQRYRYKQRALSEEKVRLLDQIGMIWEVPKPTRRPRVAEEVRPSL